MGAATNISTFARIAAVFVMCSLGAAGARAQDILITGGFLDTSGFFGGPLVLKGERGFTLNGGFLTTPYPAQWCFGGGRECAPGQLVTLAAYAVTPDLVGTMTLDGVTYTLRDFVPIDVAIMSAQFDGSFVMPPAGETATVVAPFLFRGAFHAYPATGAPVNNVGVTGSGIATITLTASLGLPGTWRVIHLRYEFGAPLPAPWQSSDVGAVGMSGSAAILNDRFVLSGEGADIWGRADAFRFAYTDLSATGTITARLAAPENSSAFRNPLVKTPTDPFAKAGVMMRGSTDPASASVIFDVKPNGELEFMARYANGESTHFLAGAGVAPRDVWLRLSRGIDNEVTAAYSPDGETWTTVGTVVVPFASEEILAGLAVTSHQPDALYAALFDQVTVRGELPNLLVNGDFEAYDPPALGPPGWISDHAFRQSPAKSETHQPRTGAQNGACWTTEYLDCGMYQEVVASVTSTYGYTVYATADRAGGLVGANVNGLLAASRDITAAPFGDYSRYTMSFTASAGDVIRVWMYSPAWPGYVVIDDARLVIEGE
jgi:hypothetical protein